MANKNTYYDDALPLIVESFVQYLGVEALQDHAILRDAEGSLTLILRKDIPSDIRRVLEISIFNIVGTYAGSVGVGTPEELFDESLADDIHDRWEFVKCSSGEYFVRMIERRLVGQDWLRDIQPSIPGVPPIVVFASHKGGVGRSTALSVACAEFASRGKSILAIDLDLEAPGLGGMFLPEGSIPEFGALDYYVENGRGNVDDNFLNRMVAVSPLTDGQGQVMIVPAVGQRCYDFPQNVIGKLSRAYLEDIEPNGSKALTFLDQTRAMIQDLCRNGSYDAIFVDARAGLNETTAATVQGLGADVLFFGIDAPQTWEGYRYFLSHLARFKPETSEDDWRFRIKMVHAKAAPDPKAWARFRDHAFELFADHLYDELGVDEADAETSFSFDLDDSTAPHYAWPILVDPSYFEFDPLAKREQFAEPIYNRTFGPFLSALSDRLGFK
ncbi:hypothetical protein [Azospirillum sp. TSH64]|uniref:KGGVGR-motif variant AAA ATPase n=1 Tax=Azospirillum sp. TSH64 TaxID=652740 RepID=UPI0011B271EC|nr:hypothetical protein [Azospirillum sp. TSH64]